MAKLPKRSKEPMYDCGLANYYGEPYLQSRRGRWYLILDDHSSEDGVLVSETFAKAWIDEFPVGKLP